MARALGRSHRRDARPPPRPVDARFRRRPSRSRSDRPRDACDRRGGGEGRGHARSTFGLRAAPADRRAQRRPRSRRAGHGPVRHVDASTRRAIRIGVDLRRRHSEHRTDLRQRDAPRLPLSRHRRPHGDLRHRRRDRDAFGLAGDAQRRVSRARHRRGVPAAAGDERRGFRGVRPRARHQRRERHDSSQGGAARPPRRRPSRGAAHRRDQHHQDRERPLARRQHRRERVPAADAGARVAGRASRGGGWCRRCGARRGRRARGERLPGPRARAPARARPRRGDADVGGGWSVAARAGQLGLVDQLHAGWSVPARRRDAGRARGVDRTLRLRPRLQPDGDAPATRGGVARLPDDWRARDAGRPGAGTVRVVDRRARAGGRHARRGGEAARGVCTQ